MKLHLVIMALAISTFAYSQSRTTGSGHLRPPTSGPDTTKFEPDLFVTPSNSAEHVAGLVKYNMQICNQDKNVNYESNHIKDVYLLVQALQFANVLEGWHTLKNVNYINNTCETGNHDYLSPDVRCLLNGTEEALYHFTKHKDSEAYLISAGLKKEDASVMIAYLKEINGIMITEKESNPTKFHFKINRTILKNLKKKEKIDN